MSYPVRFLSRTRSAWGLSSVGDVDFAGDAVVLRTRPLFGWRAAREVCVANSDVRNVEAQQKLIRLEARDGAGIWRKLVLQAADAQTGAQLAGLLPQQRTAEFIQALEQQAEFTRLLEERHAPVTWALIVANVAVFLATLLGGADLLAQDPWALVRWGSNWGLITWTGEWWRLFSSMFLHFGLLHVSFNMLALWSLGRLCEQLLGSLRFLLLYCFAGFCGSLTSLYAHPQLNSAGASGAIFGVLGALLVYMMMPHTRVPARVATPRRNNALLFICYNLLAGATHVGIDNAAHLGGLAGGMLMGALLASPLDPRAPRVAWRAPAAVVIAAALTVSSCWFITHPDPQRAAGRPLLRALASFAPTEWALDQDFLALRRQRDSGALSGAGFAAQIEATQVPRWTDARDSLDEVAVPRGSKYQQLKNLVVTYADGQRLAVHLIGEAERTGDPDTRAWADQVSTNGAQRQREIAQLMRELP